MKKSILAILLLVSLIASVSSLAFAAGNSETFFTAQLSGEEYAIIGEKYVVNLEIGNFAKEEFLGATALIDYNADVFQLDSMYLSIIGGMEAPENGSSADTYPLINPEEGWVFWGKNIVEGSNGTFMVNVLNDSNDFSSLKGNSVNCFVEFKVKDGISECETTLKIDSDAQLVGVFSETSVESFYGAGSAISINVLEEKPTDNTGLALKSSSDYSIGKDAFCDFELLKGVQPKTTVAQIKAQFNNNSELLKISANGVALVDTDFASTGSVVELWIDGQIVDRVTVVCIGDIDSSFNIDSTDYISIKKYLLNVNDLDGAFLSASDIDFNSIIDSTDYIRLKMYFLGTYDIYA